MMKKGMNSVEATLSGLMLIANEHIKGHLSSVSGQSSQEKYKFPFDLAVRSALLCALYSIRDEEVFARNLSTSQVQRQFVGLPELGWASDVDLICGDLNEFFRDDSVRGLLMIIVGAACHVGVLPTRYFQLDLEKLLVWAMHTYRSALGSPQVAREPAAAYAGLLQPSLPVAFNRRKTDRVPVQAPVQGLVSDVFTPKPMPIKASGGAFQSSMKLTERQSDVLGHLVRGKSNKRIAIELGITEGTVKIHLAAIFRALNVRNRTEAAIVASSLVSLI